MAPEILLSEGPRTTLPPSTEWETAALSVTGELLADPAAALDHRSRGRAVSRSLAPAGHYLALDRPDGEQLLLPLGDRILHLGRAFSADLRFEDARVSRRHAIIVRYGRQVRVLDDRSSEGTFVNGVRVIATSLSEGDVIRIGPMAMTYTVIR